MILTLTVKVEAKVRVTEIARLGKIIISALLVAVRAGVATYTAISHNSKTTNYLITMLYSSGKPGLCRYVDVTLTRTVTTPERCFSSTSVATAKGYSLPPAIHVM